MKFAHLAARIFNVPLMIHPAKLDAIVAGVGPRLLGVEAVDLLQEQLAPAMFSTRKSGPAKRHYDIVDGVAVINIRGGLVHRSRMETDSTFLLGYNDVAADFQHALGNPQASSIALVWDSPGGEVAGAFELAERIYAARGQKPIVSLVDGMACSAAYLCASAADKVLATPTSYVGSIGVVMRHVDMSAALQKEGLQVSYIYAGAHKVDGNPTEPLSRDVRASFQADIDGLYARFVQAVALYRGMGEQALRDTQAAVYRDAAALAARLVDGFSTVDGALAEMAVGKFSSSTHKDQAMTQATSAADGAVNPSSVDAKANSASDAQLKAACDAARADGQQQGAKAERERVTAILGHPHARACHELALQCIATGLTVDQAAAILAAVPAQAAAPATDFATHMAKVSNPDVSGIEGPADAEKAAETLVASIIKHAK